MSTIPSPSLMAKFKKPVMPTNTTHSTESVQTTAVIVAEHDPSKPKRTRPGIVQQRVEVIHDGVIKAKQLEPGMMVKAYLHGSPKGGERVVGSVERVGDGATVMVTFSSPHPATEYAAAYRFHCEALVGSAVRHKVISLPALVPYEEV